MRNSVIEIIVPIVTLLACDNSRLQPKISNEKARDTSSIETQRSPGNQKAYRDKYTFSSDSATETLYVNSISTDTIDIMWVHTNYALNESDTIQGFAFDENSGQDYEIDETEEGIAYPAKQYKLIDSGCDTYFRISVGKDIRRALVNSADCKTRKGKPIRSIGSLKWIE